MKITRDTPDQLILENTPWVLALCLLGMMVIFLGVGLATFSTEPVIGILFPLIGCGVGALLMLFMVRRTQLILDRPRDLIELRRRSFRGYTNRSFRLDELDHAIVQTSTSSDGPDTHRAALVIGRGMDAGTHPITIVYASGTGARRAADAINRWLGHATPPD